jgi:hypothetical protein
MAKNWGLILPVKAAAWGIPDRALTELAALADAAEVALSAAKNETTRTPVATAACKRAFKALEEAMRDLKKRYFFVPPLTEADLIGLGLKLPDPVHTPSGDPKAHAAAKIFLAGRHELGIRIVYVDGDPEDKANKGFRVWYKTLAPGETPPETPELSLTRSFFTRRKKDCIRFDYGDSGKTAYIAIQIENNGKKGGWGPMVSAVIP